MGTATGAGGAVAIKTGTSTNSSVAIGGIGRHSVTPSRDPQFATLLKSSPGGKGLLAQRWGLISTISPTNWTNVIWRKAMFRSVTTGALFAVTGDGVTEQTTDLTSLHTPGTDALFEIQARNGGLLWDFLIDGAIVASHSTAVPANAMYSVAGIQNNTTTDYRIDNLDLLYTYQQRS